jgi:hypothetical protein
VTRRRIACSADPVAVGCYQGMPDLTWLSICYSWAAEVRKSSGYRSFTTYPISVWLSTTLDVAESHKINAPSAC